MDDFYDEMKKILDSTVKSEESRSSNSYSPFSNLYVEALVPINPSKWLAFGAGSAMSNDMPDIEDRIKTPFDNLLVAKEYLETSQSDVQWRARFWQVAQDTTSINLASELGGGLGSFAAGATSNKIAEIYMDEMIDTAVNVNRQEELNIEIFKQTAREKGMNISRVRGTGLIREYVPEYMKGDICERPQRNSRPSFWNDDSTDDGIIFSSNSNINPKTPLNNGEELNLPDTRYGSSDYLDETIPNKNIDNDDGNIFAKFFSFLGFGGNNVGQNSPVISAQLSTEESEKLREEAEKTLLGWFFEDAGGPPTGTADPSHPANNPPLFLGEYIPPPDQ